jgi:hypothetical protein
MTIESFDEAEAFQRQIEEFARLAHRAQVAVDALQVAFNALADFPESVSEGMALLSAFASSVSADATDWARNADCEFDPSVRRSNQ